MSNTQLKSMKNSTASGPPSLAIQVSNADFFIFGSFSTL